MYPSCCGSGQGQKPCEVSTRVSREIFHPIWQFQFQYIWSMSFFSLLKISMIQYTSFQQWNTEISLLLWGFGNNAIYLSYVVEHYPAQFSVIFGLGWFENNRLIIFLTTGNFNIHSIPVVCLFNPIQSYTQNLITLVFKLSRDLITAYLSKEARKGILPRVE